MENAREKLISKSPGTKISDLKSSNLFKSSVPFIGSNQNQTKKKNNIQNNNNDDDDDDDDDLLLATENEDFSSKTNFEQRASENFSSVSKNDKAIAIKDDFNETIFNKNSFFTLFDKKSNLDNKKQNSLANVKSTNQTNNSNLLVDIGLFSDLVETDNTTSDSVEINSLNKHQHHSIVNKSNLLNNSYENNRMDGLKNPNFDYATEISHQNGHRHGHGHSHNHSHDCGRVNEHSIHDLSNRDIHESSVDTNGEKNVHCHVLDKDDILAEKRRNKTVWRKLITVLILCILFMIGEIVGGVLARSISIQTDAAHMASDIAGFFFSIVAIYVSGKAPTRRMSFGYYRSEVLGALFSILIIWILTGVLVYMAVIRLVTQDFEIDSIAMVTTASCGVFFNIVMYFVLHTNRCFNGVELSHHGHSHSGNNHGHSHGLSDNHGHSHSNNRNIDTNENHCNQNNSEVHGNNMLTKENSITMTHLSGNLNLAANTDINSGESAIAHGQVVLKVEDCHEEPVVVTPINDASNINLRAAAIHVIGDFIQSVGVLVAALIIYFEPSYKIADPICTFVFSVLVILTTAPIVKDIFFVLMEALPAGLNHDAVVTDLGLIENVKLVHSLHIWCLTMEKYCLSVHLVTVEKDVDSQTIIKEANDLLRKKYKIDRATIQVESYDIIMDSCSKCKLPV